MAAGGQCGGLMIVPKSSSSGRSPTRADYRSRRAPDFWLGVYSRLGKRLSPPSPRASAPCCFTRRILHEWSAEGGARHARSHAVRVRALVVLPILPIARSDRTECSPAAALVMVVMSVDISLAAIWRTSSSAKKPSLSAACSGASSRAGTTGSYARRTARRRPGPWPIRHRDRIGLAYARF